MARAAPNPAAAERVGAGQRVVQDGLHHRAGQAQRGTDQGGHHRDRQAQLQHDGVQHAILRLAGEHGQHVAELQQGRAGGEVGGEAGAQGQQRRQADRAAAGVIGPPGGRAHAACGVRRAIQVPSKATGSHVAW
jgi:hypothetical protein